MEKLLLIQPGKEWEEAITEYRREHFALGEKELHGSALLHTFENLDDWFRLLHDNSSEQTCRADWVPASTFLAVRPSDGRIVGMIDIRHHLNEFLSSYGGHIGYGVRPSERGKGYAAQMLTEALAFCRALGLKEAMLACYRENPASRATIQQCGGRLAREFEDGEGKTVQVFWIVITSSKK